MGKAGRVAVLFKMVGLGVDCCVGGAGRVGVKVGVAGVAVGLASTPGGDSGLGENWQPDNPNPNASNINCEINIFYERICQLYLVS